MKRSSATTSFGMYLGALTLSLGLITFSRYQYWIEAHVNVWKQGQAEWLISARHGLDESELEAGTFCRNWWHSGERNVNHSVDRFCEQFDKKNGFQLQLSTDNLANGFFSNMRYKDSALSKDSARDFVLLKVQDFASTTRVIKYILLVTLTLSVLGGSFLALVWYIFAVRNMDPVVLTSSLRSDVSRDCMCRATASDFVLLFTHLIPSMSIDVVALAHYFSSSRMEKIWKLIDLGDNLGVSSADSDLSYSGVVFALLGALCLLFAYFFAFRVLSRIKDERLRAEASNINIKYEIYDSKDHLFRPAYP
eukprot:GHVU01009973.1.p1 GENE.GHVU01009973.1~~GHVU01009973.1.p1  ORF type:complete len:307 (+),score=14.82 GHVU01009973.1:1474-2394(+)